jgi:hypothetical protein
MSDIGRRLTVSHKPIFKWCTLDLGSNIISVKMDNRDFAYMLLHNGILDSKINLDYPFSRQIPPEEEQNRWKIIRNNAGLIRSKCLDYINKSKNK